MKLTVPKKRGRPPKRLQELVEGAESKQTEMLVEAVSGTKKRPLKRRKELVEDAEVNRPMSKVRHQLPKPKPKIKDGGHVPSVPRKRGRPCKIPATIAGEEESTPMRRGRLPGREPAIDEATVSIHPPRQKLFIVDSQAVEEMQESSVEASIPEEGPPQERIRIDTSPLTSLDESNSPSPLDPETVWDIEKPGSGINKSGVQIDTQYRVEQDSPFSQEVSARISNRGIVSSEDADVPTPHAHTELLAVSQPPPVSPENHPNVPEALVRYKSSVEQNDSHVPIDPVLLMQGTSGTRTAGLDPNVSEVLNLQTKKIFV
jgi:hypothetical protein